MKTKIIILFLLFSILLPACHSAWEISITGEGHPEITVSKKDISFYIEKSDEEITEIPLGQILYANGYSLIDSIRLLLTKENSTHYFNWEVVASVTTIEESGSLNIDGVRYSVKSIAVTPSYKIIEIDYSIMDIAPSLAYALDLPNLPDAEGINRTEIKAMQGLMILLDGLQYQKLIEMIEAGRLPFFENHKNEIHQGLTVYPPITTSASAALFTSTPPQRNGVYGYGYRSTELTTLFDVAFQAGKSVFAVEGASLPFNLRNADVIMSGDRDGNGYSDDNVFLNSIEKIKSGMPELMYIHFHEIDDMGHSYGPASTQYEEALIRVDGYLTEIYETLPENTLIAIFADHGMHATEEGGNHGTLTAEDLIIPIVFIKK